MKIKSERLIRLKFFLSKKMFEYFYKKNPNLYKEFMQTPKNMFLIPKKKIFSKQKEIFKKKQIKKKFN